MSSLLLLPLALQALLMVLDEVFFHRKRRLPLWERIGHPLDTLTVLACYAWVLFVSYGPDTLKAYVGLAAFSTLFVTKDEFVHKQHCSGTEQWLHSLLFVLHPVVFLVLAIAWPHLHDASSSGDATALVLQVQFYATLAFAGYQTLYWNIPWKPSRRPNVA